jgi:hypothetical protein
MDEMQILLKQDIINRYKKNLDNGFLYDELLIFVFIDDKLIFSKNFSFQKDAESLGW